MPAYSRILLPWDSQPQEAVEANPDWQSRGLIGLWNFANGLTGTVGGAVSFSGTAPDFALSRVGAGWKNTAIASNQKLVLPDLSGQIALTNQVTLVLILGGGNNTTQGLCNLGGVNDTTQSDHYPYRPASTDLIYSSIFKSNRWVSGVTSKIDHSMPHVVAVQFKNGKQRYTQAGIELTTATNAVNPIWPSWARLLVSDHAGYAYSGVTLGAAVFNQYIEDAELATLTRSIEDAWQLFAPRTIWVPVSAGGGGGVNLVIADSAHAHAADNIGLTLDTYLAVNEALHAHTADNLTLSTTGSTDLTVADSAHAQALDNVVLTSQAYLAVADMLHAHALDGVTLTLGGASLTVAELLHAHALDGAALTLDTYLEVDDAVHGHTLDGIVLTPVGTDAVAVSLGGRAKPHRKGLRFQDYDVPLPPEVLTSTIPQDTPPTGIKPAPSLSAYALRPASKLATRPARVKAPKAQAPAPAPVATPESQATPAVAIVPVVAAAAPVSAAAKPPRAMALADILSAQDLTHDELLQAVKLLARELQDGPALRLVRSHRIALRR